MTSFYVGMLAVALIVFSIAVYVSVQAFLVKSLEHSLRTNASSILIDYVKPLNTKGLKWFISEMTESYPPDISDTFVRISRNSVVLYETSEMREKQTGVPGSVSPNLQGEFSGIRRERLTSGQEMLLYQLAYPAPGGAVMLIETGATMNPVNQILRRLALILLIGTPVVVVLSAVGGYLVMTRALQPVVTLTDWAERVGGTDLGGRLPVISSGDELERLSLSLNRMIDRLEQSVAHNRRFSADASHELRTPLTIVRGELEVLLQIPKLPIEVAEGIGSALEESHRMSRIVESLMTISRLEGGSDQMEMAPVDLVSIVQTTRDHMSLLAEENNILLLCEARGPIHVMGDAMRLKQVAVNLLDNAIKYTARNGRVEVAVYTEGTLAVLEVSDTGIGIPEASLPLIFERFYRADAARSRESGGMGLGLSIVKSICLAHHGEISASSVAGQGTVLRVGLPLLQNADVGSDGAPLTPASQLSATGSRSAAIGY
ncbi:MAG: HAMP domain-containing histidine kinase [Acidobacteriota bacterium]|nr:HAMP domain-containing histidine kinase [Acidobacteriota bacterium]